MSGWTQRGQLRGSSGTRGSRSEARDPTQRANLASAAVVCAVERNIDVGSLAVDRELKSCRKNSRDAVGNVVQSHDAANDTRAAAVSAMPEVVGQPYNVIGTRYFIGSREARAGLWVYLQRVEESASNLSGKNDLDRRRRIVGESPRPSAISGLGGERAAVNLEFQNVSPRDGLVDGDQAGGIREWKRTEQQRINQREDCRRGPDAHAKREYTSGKVARCAGDISNRVAEEQNPDIISGLLCSIFAPHVD
jgi:hypothetical protein